MPPISSAAPIPPIMKKRRRDRLGLVMPAPTAALSAVRSGLGVFRAGADPLAEEMLMGTKEVKGLGTASPARHFVNGSQGKPGDVIGDFFDIDFTGLKIGIQSLDR